MSVKTVPIHPTPKGVGPLGRTEMGPDTTSLTAPISALRTEPVPLQEIADQQLRDQIFSCRPTTTTTRTEGAQRPRARHAR